MSFSDLTEESDMSLDEASLALTEIALDDSEVAGTGLDDIIEDNIMTTSMDDDIEFFDFDDTAVAGTAEMSDDSIAISDSGIIEGVSGRDWGTSENLKKERLVHLDIT